MKKSLALVCAALFLLLFFCACEGKADQPSIAISASPAIGDAGLPLPSLVADSDSREMNRALSLGIVPAVLRGDETAPVSFREFCALIDNMAALCGERQEADWEQLSAAARVSEEKMLRQDGMLALFYAAQALRIDNYAASGENDQQDDQALHALNRSQEYPQFPSWRESVDIGGRENVDRLSAAALFALHRVSKWTGRSVFEPDANGSLRPTDPLTHGEAILAVLRLYDSQISDAERDQLGSRPDSEFDRKLILAAEERKKAVLGSESAYEVRKALYYVSTRGNDANDGLSQETAWATLERVNKARLNDGDAVLFERGGVWRGMLIAQKGVTYSAYGMGGKPKLLGSCENGGEPGKWSLLSGSDTIWVYYKEIPDCGTLLFNGGASWALKETPSFVNGKFVLRGIHDADFDVRKQLDRDLEFFCAADSSLIDGVPFRYAYDRARRVVGTLYLRSDKGNPGKRFGSIEFAERGSVIVPADDAIFDNLCVQCGGTSGISDGNTRVTVRNCEFAFLGGAVGYYDGSGDAVCGGSAVETVGACDGFDVSNNYIHDVSGAGVSCRSQTDGDSEPVMKNITCASNLIERCTYGFEVGAEISMHAQAPSAMQNLLLDNNYIFYTGTGYGARETNYGEPASIQLWQTDNPGENFSIQNNILYLCTARLLQGGAQPQWRPHLFGNIYVQSKTGLLGNWKTEAGKQTGDYSFSCDHLAFVLRDVFGDEAAVLPPDILQ